MSFQAGFSRVVINPDNGVGIEGYFIIRKTEGILDDIEINSLALEDNGKRVVMMSCDLCFIRQRYMDDLRKAISIETNLPMDQIFVSCTHTHTGPIVANDDADALINAYYPKLKAKLIEGAKAALMDLKPAKVGWKISHVPNMSHGRRFLMKDGTTATNPGHGNPNAVKEVSIVDDRVNVVRYDREGGDTIVTVNYGNHPDSVGGNKISADYPGFLRRTVERALPGTKCIYFNGAEGDIGFIDIWAKEGDLNGTFNDFDNVLRGYAHSRHYGQCLAGCVLQVYEKVNYFEPHLTILEKVMQIPSNMPKPEEMEQAHYINDMHQKDRDSELPYKAMELTTVVAEAERMCKLEHGPESFPVRLAAVSLGDIVYLGIAGEPFTGIGLSLKETEGYRLIMPICNANGAEGYYPMKENYDEGGYETRSSYFKPGVAEFIIDEGKKILGEVK